MRSPTSAVLAYVRASGEDFRVSRGPPTVPLTWILRNLVFLKFQNPGNAGTHCITKITLLKAVHETNNEKNKGNSSGGENGGENAFDHTCFFMKWFLLWYRYALLLWRELSSNIFFLKCFIKLCTHDIINMYFICQLTVDFEAWSASDFLFQETRILTPDQARGFKMTFWAVANSVLLYILSQSIPLEHEQRSGGWPAKSALKSISLHLNDQGDFVRGLLSGDIILYVKCKSSVFFGMKKILSHFLWSAYFWDL